MKKITLLVATLMIMTAILFTGCDVIITSSEDGEKGSGNLETRQYDFTDFTKVEIGNAFDYEIEQSDTCSVSITVDDNIFEHIEVKQDGQTLIIRLKPFLHLGSATLEASITMPRLTGLESSGATRGIVTGFNSSDNLELEMSGASNVNLVNMTAGDIEGNISGASKLRGEINASNVDLQISGASETDGFLTAANVKLEVSGASRIEFSGSGNSITVDASGASRVRLGDYSVDNAIITLSGASNCRIDVAETLDIDLSGFSELEYTGRPVIGSINTSGGSQIKQVNGD